MHIEIQAIKKQFVAIIFIIVFHTQAVASEPYCVQRTNNISSSAREYCPNVRMNKNLIDEKYIIMSNQFPPPSNEPYPYYYSSLGREEVSFEIVNMQDNKTLQCGYDHNIKYFDTHSSCLLNSTMPLIAAHNKIYRYELSNTEQLSVTFISCDMSAPPKRELQLKQTIEGIFDNSEKFNNENSHDKEIVKIDCTKSYVVVVGLKGSVAKFSINNNEIQSDRKKKYLMPVKEKVTSVVTCVALDEQNNILFLGFSTGSIGYCQLDAAELDVDIISTDLGYLVDCIDVYDNKVVFGGRNVFGVLKIDDLLQQIAQNNQLGKNLVALYDLRAERESTNIIDLFWLRGGRLFIEKEDQHYIITFDGQYQNQTFSNSVKKQWSNSLKCVRGDRKDILFVPLQNRDGFYKLKISEGSSGFRYLSMIEKYVIPVSLLQKVKVRIQSAWLEHPYMLSAGMGILGIVLMYINLCTL